MFRNNNGVPCSSVIEHSQPLRAVKSQEPAAEPQFSMRSSQNAVRDGFHTFCCADAVVWETGQRDLRSYYFVPVIQSSLLSFKLGCVNPFCISQRTKDVQPRNTAETNTHSEICPHLYPIYMKDKAMLCFTLTKGMPTREFF